MTNLGILDLAHVCTKDDVYDGYFIPKGTLVLANSWSVLFSRSLNLVLPDRFIQGDSP